MKPAHENVLTPARLLEAATQQRRILRLLLISIPVAVGTVAVPSVTEPGPAILIMLLLLFVGMIAIGLLSVVAVYRLANALRVQAPWVFVVCSFIPYINTVVLLIINGRATSALTRAGIRVGLMGADRGDLERVGATSPAATAASAPSSSPRSPRQ